MNASRVSPLVTLSTGRMTAWKRDGERDMGELVRMPGNTTIFSPTEDVDPQHPQAQVLMVIHGDVYMTMTPPPDPEPDEVEPEVDEPGPRAELEVDLTEQTAPFQAVVQSFTWPLSHLLRRGKHRPPRKGSRA